MSAHGIPSPTSLEKLLKVQGLTVDMLKVRRPPAVRPYRNLFGPAALNELYQGHPDGPAATRAMLARLATHMKVCYPWPDFGGRPCTRDDNENIPSGYTYLAQIVAHDLVHNAGPLPRSHDESAHLARDFRVNRLMLDTIYGGGPMTGPLCYERSDTTNGQRHTLRLGCVGPPGGSPGAPLVGEPTRDIGRMNCPFLSDSRDPASSIPNSGMPDALLADPRNDDHLIISQLTAVLHEFHNIVWTRVRPSTVDEFSDYRAFLLVRKAVALVFRRIVRKDLLGRLLEPGTYAYYADESRKWPDDFLDQESDNLVPIEFSHAAYRFGHVMVRFSYRLNDKLQNNPSIADILNRSSARRAYLLPIACDWLIDWSMFFDMGDGKRQAGQLNFSRGLRPYIAGDLSQGIFFPNEDGSGGMSADGGIFYRDFVRGLEAGTRSVKSLIAKLRPHDKARAPLLADSNYREHELGEWLKRQDRHLLPGDEPAKFTDLDRVSLSQDPPLAFFVLFEAAHCQEGKRLGVLGSTIVAEVIFSALARTRANIEGDAAVVQTAERVFGPRFPETMPDLIRFIAGSGGLAAVARCA